MLQKRHLETGFSANCAIQLHSKNLGPMLENKKVCQSLKQMKLRDWCSRSLIYIWKEQVKSSIASMPSEDPLANKKPVLRFSSGLGKGSLWQWVVSSRSLNLHSIVYQRIQASGVVATDRERERNGPCQSPSPNPLLQIFTEESQNWRQDWGDDSPDR